MHYGSRNEQMRGGMHVVREGETEILYVTPMAWVVLFELSVPLI